MIGSDYDNPIVYQDLGAYSMNPYGMPISGVAGGGMPYANSSYLGGVAMQPQLCQDKVDLINKKDAEGNKTLKKVAYTLGALLLIGYVPYFRKQITKAGGVAKYLSNKWTSITDSIKNAFNSKPELTRWQKFKNWFGRTNHTNPSGQSPLGWS